MMVEASSKSRLVLLAKDRGLRQRWKAAVAPARLPRAGSLARRQQHIEGQALRERAIHTSHTANMRPTFAKLAGGNGEISRRL